MLICSVTCLCMLPLSYLCASTVEAVQLKQYDSIVSDSCIMLNNWSKVPLTQFLQVITILIKTTFSQIKNLHGNTTTTLHIQMTFSSLHVIIHNNTSSGSFYKNPLQDRCELTYLLTNIIIVYMCKAVNCITLNVIIW